MGLDASHSPSSDSSANRTMFWGLNQRIENTARRLTEALSFESERQRGLIQVLTNSFNQHEQEQREAMARITSRIERNEQAMVGLQNVTETLASGQRELTASQEQNEQKISTVEAEIRGLKEQVQVLQQQQEAGRALRNVPDSERALVNIPVSPSTDDSDYTVTAPRGVIFTDADGRKRRLCWYCGQKFAAKYCLEHERKRVCLRRR